MGLTTPLPSSLDGGELPKEAAIFWKHASGKFTPLKVHFLTYYGANYRIEPLENVLYSPHAQVHPLPLA